METELQEVELIGGCFDGCKVQHDPEKFDRVISDFNNSLCHCYEFRIRGLVFTETVAMGRRQVNRFDHSKPCKLVGGPFDGCEVPRDDCDRRDHVILDGDFFYFHAVDSQLDELHFFMRVAKERVHEIPW